MHASIRVTLLGQNSIIREGLRRILADENFTISQSVEDQSLLSDNGRDDDLLILVDGSEAVSGIEQIRILHARYPSVKLVVLSDRFELQSMVGAFQAGVHGYLVKEISFQPLIGSLRLVAMGEKVMPSRLVDELPLRSLNEERECARDLIAGANLSERESEILQCLIMGCPNKVISRRLAISEETVKVHVKAILRKLRVRNRTQAAICAVSGGLESPVLDLPLDGGLVATDAGPRRLPIVRAA